MTLFALTMIALVFYVYFGYFALVIVLAQIIRRKVYQREIQPSVALMIAAYNEEQGIAKKIDNSLQLLYPKEKLRIIVVSDGSSDRTDEIVKSYAHAGVELIRVEGRVGKTEARNVAIKEIDSEIVLFSDATTEYRPDIIKKMVRNFADPEVGMVTGHLIYRNDQNSPMGLGQKLFWKYESLIKNAQTKLGTLTGSVGCATSFRRVLYSPLPANIIEDFTEPLMFVIKGKRVVYEPEAICYELPTPKSQNEWKMRVRVVRGGMSGMLYAKKILNPFRYPIASFQLISHKILRWLVPVFGICILLATLSAIILTPNPIAIALALLQLVFYACAAVAFILEKKGMKIKILSIPLYFIVLNAASLVALYKTITTQLEATWETDRG
jgi:cellulose synthase/poly-beta-1,6-N-acetylglucosamine synthase-like glycosyltransferase